VMVPVLGRSMAGADIGGMRMRQVCIISLNIHVTFHSYLICIFFILCNRVGL
jgi:hypothetical protein